MPAFRSAASVFTAVLAAQAFLTAVPSRAAADSAGAPMDSAALAQAVAAFTAHTDSLAASLTYETGVIELGNGLAKADLPAGWRYLDPDDASVVLSGIWGNPPGTVTLGMLFPPGATPQDDSTWAVVLSFDEDGYVKDDDAEKIDYDDLLKKMKEESEADNKERAEAGYDAVTLIGWAEKPHYDKASNKLYWAKELRFGKSAENTLNYNIRALGRRGVLVLNAVSSITALPKVREGMQAIIPAVAFKEGHTYAEFDPKIDKVATYGLAGLVAGTLLAKGGILKVILAALIAGKKFVIIGLAGLGAVLAKIFRGRAEEKKAFPDESKKVG